MGVLSHPCAVPCVVGVAFWNSVLFAGPVHVGVGVPPLGVTFDLHHALSIEAFQPSSGRMVGRRGCQGHYKTWTLDSGLWTLDWIMNRSVDWTCDDHYRLNLDLLRAVLLRSSLLDGDSAGSIARQWK